MGENNSMVSQSYQAISGSRNHLTGDALQAAGSVVPGAAQSRAFYGALGYPEYAGRYAPFVTPEGYHVENIVETPDGLQVTFRSEPSAQQPVAYAEDNYSGFVVHQEMKDAMTRQQEAYAKPVTAQPTGNPVYNATHSSQESQLVSPTEASSVVQVLTPNDFWKAPTPETIAQGAQPSSKAVIINQPKQVDAFGFIKTIAANPIGTISAILNPIAEVQAKDTSIVGKATGAYVGAAGFYVNTAKQAETKLANIGENLKQKPISSPLEPKIFTVPSVISSKKQDLPLFTPKSEAQQFGYDITEVGAAVTVAAALPTVGGAVGVGALNVVAGEGIGVVINQTIKAASGEGFLTPKEFSQAAVEGGVFTIGSGAVFQGIAKTAPSIVASRIGQAGVGAVIGGAVGHATSGGDPLEAGKGALIGGAMTLGTNLAVSGAKFARVKLPTRVGGTMEMIEGPPTIGAGGREVPTAISKNPITELDGKRLRIVFDVTENPVGTKGVTTRSLVSEYTGKTVPTAHATTGPENFNLKAGGETLLKGFPSESKGFRASEELYPFYSAPGNQEFVTVYGGYAGIGKGYSGTVAKMVFNTKTPAALVTLDTKVSPEFLKIPGETQANYLNRVTSLSGKTGIAPETLLGKSAERQLVTPTAYNRAGVELPGSKYVSEGKIGTFTVKVQPEGKTGRIPLLRELATEYKELDVYKGSYKEVTNASPTAKILNVNEYGKSYVETKQISTPKLAFGLTSGYVSPSKQGQSIAKSINSDVISEPASSKQSNNSKNQVSFSNSDLSYVPVSSPIDQFSFVPDFSPEPSPSKTPEYTPYIIPGGYPSDTPKDTPSLIPNSIPNDFPKDTPSFTPDPIPFTTSKPSRGNPYDFKFEGRGPAFPSIIKLSSLKSRKKVYPILTASDVLGLNKRRKNSPKKHKTRRRHR
jgi:hypothetical protein